MLVAVSVTHHWWNVSWVEWFGVIGVLAAVIGVILTWFQARRAKTNAFEARDAASAAKVAAEAASAAVDRTQRQLRANQMLVLIPQLRWVASELDAAIGSDDRAMTRRHLDQWRWQAGHVNGLLKDETPTPRTILKSLQDSVGLATAATSTLLKDDGKPVFECCEQARAAIGEACNQMNVFVGRNASQVQATDMEPSK